GRCSATTITFMSYSAYFTLSIREAEHVLKALVITVILVGCVQAQEQQEPSNFDIPPRAHQEFLRKTSEGEIERTSSSRRQQVRLAQIREDSRAIQTINAEAIRPALQAPSLDYKRVAKAASEIKRRAVRLQKNLALPEPLEPSDQRTSWTTSYVGQIKVLDGLIWDFVSNPLFRNTDLIDVQLAAEASKNLHGIVSTSDWFKSRPRIILLTYS